MYDARTLGAVACNTYPQGESNPYYKLEKLVS